MTQLDTIQRELAQIRTTVDRIEHGLNGNGRPGLKTRVALLEQWIGGARRLVAIVVGSALAAISSAAVVLFKAVIGGGP